MSRIDAVLVDAGGVLVLPDPARLRDALERHGGDPDADLVRCHYLGAAAWQVPDTAHGGGPRYTTAFAHHARVPEDRIAEVTEELADFFRGARNWTFVLDGAPDALARMVSAGARVAIVSNSDGTVEDHLRRMGVCQVGPGPGAEVALVLDSEVVGSAKPDTRIFEVALEELGVAPERAVHVGDTLHADVAGARAAGVRPLHFDPYDLCGAEDHEHVASLGDVADLVDGTGGSR